MGCLLQGTALPNIKTTQCTSTTAPAFYNTYLQQLAGCGAKAAQNSQYIGAQPLQTQAFNTAASTQGQYQPMINQAQSQYFQASNINPSAAATNTITQALGNNAVGAASPYLSSAANVNTLGAAQPYLNLAAQGTCQTVKNFMNPYTQCVVNAIGNLGQANIAQNLAPGANAGLVGSGQFGSSRGTQALGQVLSNAGLGITAQQACALKSGYTQAMCAAQKQAALYGQLGSTAGSLANQQAQNELAAGSALGQLTNQQMQNQLAAGQLQGCLAYKTQAGMLNAGNALSNLATTQGALNTQCLNNLATLGAQQQQIAQGAQCYGLNQLAKESNLIKGLTVPTSTSSKYCGPIPGAYNNSPLSQIAGLGSFAQGIFGKCGVKLSSIGDLSKIFGSTVSPPSDYNPGTGDNGGIPGCCCYNAVIP
jgi:hypothetical protein